MDKIVTWIMYKMINQISKTASQTVSPGRDDFGGSPLNGRGQGHRSMENNKRGRFNAASVTNLRSEGHSRSKAPT